MTFSRIMTTMGLALVATLAACGDNSDDTQEPLEPLEPVPVAECSTNDQCDDGLFCNGAELCDVALGSCVAGSAPQVDDGVACTVDSCDEDADAILHLADNGSCDDALFCNGVETCDAALGCVAGVAPTADDGIECTNAACDEETDSIVQVPDDSMCSDALFCNGAETCSAMVGCVAGLPPVLDDGLSCTSDMCDEVNDVVVHAPDDGRCDDSDMCNGIEICDGMAGCVAGSPPASEDVDITQSADSETIIAQNSIMCGSGGLHTENSYYRVFDLDAEGIGCDFDITSVDVGIELAQAGGDTGAQPMTVALHTLDGDLQSANLTTVASVDIDVADQANTVLEVPIAARVSAAELLVVEVMIPNGQGAGHSFFIGSNNAGQSGPSFIRAPDCGVGEPGDAANLGFPNMHLVLDIHGSGVVVAP